MFFAAGKKLSATAKIFRIFLLSLVNNFVNSLRTGSENAVNSENKRMLARLLPHRAAAPAKKFDDEIHAIIAHDPNMSAEMKNLGGLLRERLAVIADHSLRDRDPAAHLRKLQEVSEALGAEHQRLRSVLPARLNHFLASASYQKALAFVEGEGG